MNHAGNLLSSILSAHAGTKLMAALVTLEFYHTLQKLMHGGRSPQWHQLMC